MSDLSNLEKNSLEKLFEMRSGYVLNFSNRTFQEFVLDSTRKNIYESDYLQGSGSKANRLRAFWSKEQNEVVGRVLNDLLDYTLELGVNPEQEKLVETCRRIAQRLLNSASSKIPHEQEADISRRAEQLRLTRSDDNTPFSKRTPNEPKLRSALNVFLCHASGDKQAVRKLYSKLKRDGFFPWLDEKHLIAGQNWRAQIKEAVQTCDVVIVCLSKKSITKQGFVQKEIKFALDVEEEKPEGTIFIIPVLLEEVDVPERLCQLQCAYLHRRGGYKTLVDALRIRVDEKGATAGDPSAMYNLGLSFLEGRGVVQNYKQAGRYFEKAAAAGNQTARTRLADPQFGPKETRPLASTSTGGTQKTESFPLAARTQYARRTDSWDAAEDAAAGSDDSKLATDLPSPLPSDRGAGAPKAFISYSHDSERHLNRVLSLSDKLRADGIDCHLDCYEESPPQGWPRWCEKQVRDANFVLVACTEVYLRRFLGEEEHGRGQGGTWEGHIITQELYNAQGSNSKFLPILFDGQQETLIPIPLQSATHYKLPERYEDLYRRLTNQPLIVRPALGSLKTMPRRKMPALPVLKPRKSFLLPETESFSHEETICSGGGHLYNDLIAENFISYSVGALYTVRNLIEQIALHSNKPIPIESMKATFGEEVAPRGRTLFGNPGNVLEQILSAHPGVRWWISNKGLNIRDERPDEAIAKQVPEPSEDETRQIGNVKSVGINHLYSSIEKVPNAMGEVAPRTTARRSQNNDMNSRSPARYIMAADPKDKHILDTNAWNHLFDDPEREHLLEVLRTTVILPTALAIFELAATKDSERRHGLLRLVKSAGQDNRPLAMPNQLMVLACQGYARRDSALTLNGGADAQSAWAAVNDPELVDTEMQRLVLEFNQNREEMFRKWSGGLRAALQRDFGTGVEQPRSMSALIRHYSRNDDFLYKVVNRIYERSVGTALPRNELRSLLSSLPYWPVFLMGYACGIYQRAVRDKGFSRKRNPGYLDLWSATYLPACDVFITSDHTMRRALKVINRGSAPPARIISFTEWKQKLLQAESGNYAEDA